MITGKGFFWKYKLDHILFWLFTVLFHAYIRRYLIDKAGWQQFALEIIIRNGLLAMIVYANLLIVLPIFKSKKYNAAIGSWLLLLIFYTVLKSLHDEYLYGYIINDPEKKKFWTYTYYNFSTSLFYLVFTMALQFTKEWFYQREHFQKIKIEHLNSEINYLKAQVNPHFLFNSLNTLYVQIDEQNTTAKETLEKISEMLRYQLYECNNHLINIEKELAYIENYIDLQRLRKEENFKISYQYGNDVKDFEIAPLLIIPFVENAFKHLSNFKERENIVNVTIQKESNRLVCNFFNTKPDVQKKNGEGIGLKNVKRRLELLYPNKYNLQINEQASAYEVTLTIAL